MLLGVRSHFARGSAWKVSAEHNRHDLNHSDNAGLHCWIQREAGDGLLELPVDEERGHSSAGKRRRSVIV